MNTILFGAGKIGHKFIQSRCFEELKADHRKIAFYDNNSELPKILEGIERLDELDYVAQNSEVIITCGAWTQVYRQCLECGYKDIKIYDEKSDKVMTLKDYSRSSLGYYENEKCALYQLEKEKAVLLGKEKFFKTRNLYESITEVAIMLSNLCNYASVHSKCPASYVTEKQIMPSKIVYRILDELAESQFSGTICFHIYNEPLIDPRLFMFIEYTKKVMPKSKVRIYSNGYYLNETMFVELKEIGTDILVTTGYGKSEYKRLIDLDNDIMAFSVLYGNLDDRIDYYTKRNTTYIVSNDVCDTYIYQVPIYTDGDIGTCCLDYKHPYALGNISETSLEKCLNNERLIEFQDGLLKGDRTSFTICTNCYWKR